MTSVQPEAVLVNRGQPGETLRKAREARGLALNEVAVSLNLSPAALSNLESGAFDRLPGHTFARGYIRAYAKLLGMDQDLLVREFDQITGTDATGSNVSSLGRIEEPARVSQGLLRMISLVVLAIVVLAGVLWWQDDSAVNEDLALSTGLDQVEVESADGTTQIHPLEPEDQAVAVIEQESVVPVPQAVGDAQSPSTEVVIQPSVSTASPALSQTVTATAQVTEPANGVVPNSAAVVAAPEVVATASAAADQVNSVVAAPGEGVLDVRFTANCWAQVTDADGKVLFSALKRAGESINVAAKMPVELRLGYASGAQVTFNGKTVDIQPFTTGETARLKLGQ